MGAFLDGINIGIQYTAITSMFSRLSPYRNAFFAQNFFNNNSLWCNPLSCLNLSISAPQLNYSFNPPSPNFNLSLSNGLNQNCGFNIGSISSVWDYKNYNFPSNNNFMNFSYTNPWSTPNINNTRVTRPESHAEENPADKTIVASHTAQELYNKWSKKPISENAELTPEFCEKVIQISKRINCDADDLMTLMFHESRFSPKAINEKNKYKNAGLIQFGWQARHDTGVPGIDKEEYKRGMNGTKEEKEKTIEREAEVTLNNLLKTSAMKQLDYVEKYFMQARKDRKIDISVPLTLGTMGALAFRPAYAKYDVLAEKGCDAYENNKKLDKNHDGKIDKKELEARLRECKA